jgi:hypothetical protein
VTTESQILIGSIVGGTGALLSYWAGWRARGALSRPPAPPYRRDRDPDWRRSFNHENINRPTGQPPLRLRRSGDGYSSGPTTPKPGITPKPQFPPPQIIREDFLQ